MKFITIHMLLVSIKCFITSDSGKSDNFDYLNGFSCADPSTTTSVITFAGTFENPPQVLISLYRTTAYQTPGNFYQIDIIQVTTQYFETKISCAGVSRYNYDWYAINDNRIQILHPTKQTNLVDGSIFTHSHSLQNVKKATVIIDCLIHLGRPLNFYLEVYQVTSKDVQIKLHNLTSKLVELGYSIVLGTEEAFQLSDLIITSDTPY